MTAPTFFTNLVVVDCRLELAVQADKNIAHA
jgi:hypothetical protein